MDKIETIETKGEREEGKAEERIENKKFIKDFENCLSLFPPLSLGP